MERRLAPCPRHDLDDGASTAGCRAVKEHARQWLPCSICRTVVRVPVDPFYHGLAFFEHTPAGPSNTGLPMAWLVCPVYGGKAHCDRHSMPTVRVTVAVWVRGKVWKPQMRYGIVRARVPIF